MAFADGSDDMEGVGGITGTGGSRYKPPTRATGGMTPHFPGVPGRLADGGVRSRAGNPIPHPPATDPGSRYGGTPKKAPTVAPGPGSPRR